jgi:hypothetical protein
MNSLFLVLVPVSLALCARAEDTEYGREKDAGGRYATVAAT